MLGLGESAGFPAAASLLTRHLPSQRLGSANALISSGISLGPAVGAFVGGMVVAGAGWRALFLVFGAASLLWLVPWLAFARGEREAAVAARVAPEPGYRELLSRREL